MNKESENLKDIENIVDHLKVRKAIKSGNVLQTHSQMEQPPNQYSDALLGIRSDSDEYNKENVLDIPHMNNEQKTELTTDLADKYRLIACNTSDLIAFTTFDVDPIFTFVSPSHKKILGYEEGDLLGRSGLDFIHDDDKQQIMAILLTYIDTKIKSSLTPDLLENAQKLDFRFRDKSGQWHFLRSTVDIAKDELLFISKDITEQKCTEEQLRHSNELFSKAFHSSPEMITITSLKEGRYVDVNESFLSNTGYSHDEVIGHTATELNIWFDPSERAKFISGLKECGSVRNLELRMRKKTGEVGTVLMSAEIIDIKGESCVLTVSTNITDRKRFENKLGENEQRMKAIIQGLSIAAFVIGGDHRVLYWNKALEELSNIRAGEIVGTANHWKAFYDKERPCMADVLIDSGLENIEKWYAGKYKKSPILKDSYEAIDFFPNLGNGGKWLRFNTTVIRNTSGGLVGVLETLEDISERKKAEESLCESEERFRLAISSITDILYEWNIKTGMMQWFGDIESRLGYENGTFPRTLEAFLKHVHPEDVEDVQAVATKGLKSHQKWQGEYRVIKKDGVEVDWYGTGIGIYDTEGNPFKVVGAIEDITERKHAEHALQESRQMLRLIMDTIPARVFWKDRNSNYMGCNQSFVHDAGRHSTEEIIGKNDFELGWAEQAELYRADDQFVIQSGQSKCNYEEPQTTPDGRKIWLRTSKIPLLDAEKNIIGVLGTYEDITDQKQAQDALRRSEEQYLLVTENVSDVIWTMDLNLRFTYFSPSNEKLIGYATEKALNLSLSELLTPESLELALQTFSAELELENNETKDISRYVTLELNEIRADGTIVPVEVRMSFLRDAQKNPIGILGVTRDITERKRQEISLKKSEEKFIKAFKSSPIAIAINRISDGKFLEANETFEKLSGYSRDEFLAQSPIELSAWVDFNDIRRFEEEFTKTGSVYNHEYRFRTKVGNVIITRFSTELIDFNDEPCYLSVLVDITEQKKMEESLRENEEKYRSIVENTQDVIMLTSPDGRVSYMSPSCVNVLGYSPDDLVGKIPEIFYPEDIEKVHNALSSATQGNKGSNLEYRILTKDGTTKWVSHSWSPLVTDNHELKCIVSVVRDVTESKNAEQTLKQKIEELEKYKNVTVNREVKMVDLKNEINELYKQLNQKPKYPSV